MNTREEDLFLWGWARRRREGRRASIVRGLSVGAIGGLAFAALMLFAMTQDGASFRVTDEGVVGAIASVLGPTIFLFAISIVMFGGLGVFVTFVIWRRMEWRYHALLDAGRHVPADQPVLTAAEKRTTRIFIGGFVLLALVLLGLVFWEIKYGAL